MLLKYTVHSYCREDDDLIIPSGNTHGVSMVTLSHDTLDFSALKVRKTIHLMRILINHISLHS